MPLRTILPPRRMTWMASLASVSIAVLAGAAPSQEAIDLFPDQSFAEWIAYDGSDLPGGWEWTPAGELHLHRPRGGSGGLVSRRSFGDFDLTFEWRIERGGNNGVMYRVRPYGDRWRGIEYQILDQEGRRRPERPTGRVGAIYDLYAPTLEPPLEPAPNFNVSRVRVQRGVVEHWLNGALVAQADMGSPDWRERYVKSKYAELPNWGDSPGRIMISDHNSEVWYRNFRMEILGED